MQIIRALLVVSEVRSYRNIVLRDKILSSLRFGITENRFEFKKGNSMATLSQSVSENCESWFFNIKEGIEF
jgi:hypothetical protein